MMKLNEIKVKELLRVGLKEDVGTGDITSAITIDKNLKFMLI